VRLVRVEAGSYRSDDGAITVQEVSGNAPFVWLAKNRDSMIIARGETLTEVRRKLARPAKPAPVCPIMVECEECGGHGEHQAECDNCRARLTTANQSADEPSWCAACYGRVNGKGARR